MASALITGANRESGLSLRDSIWLMAGRSTRLVVIPLLLRSCADLPTGERQQSADLGAECH